MSTRRELRFKITGIVAGRLILRRKPVYVRSVNMTYTEAGLYANISDKKQFLPEIKMTVCCDH